MTQTPDKCPHCGKKHRDPGVPFCANCGKEIEKGGTAKEERVEDRGQRVVNGKKQEADKLEAAVAAVIAEGKNVTYDMKPDRNDPTAVGTSEMADAIIEKIKK